MIRLNKSRPEAQNPTHFTFLSLCINANITVGAAPAPVLVRAYWHPVQLAPCAIVILFDRCRYFDDKIEQITTRSSKSNTFYISQFMHQCQYHRRGGPCARPCPGLLAPCAIVILFDRCRLNKSRPEAQNPTHFTFLGASMPILT